MAKYGQGGRVESAAASGDDFTGAASQVYTFATPVKKAFVVLSPSATTTHKLYIVCNADSAATTDWEFILTPGDVWFSPDGCTVSQVAIYGNAAMTYKTDFCVRGFE